MATTVDAFRLAYRAHLRECPLPDGSPDRGRCLEGLAWGHYAPLGWVEPLEPAPCRAWRLTIEGQALAESVQLHAGRPASSATVERARAREAVKDAARIARGRVSALRAARVIVATHGPELAAEAFAEALG